MITCYPKSHNVMGILVASYLGRKDVLSLNGCTNSHSA